MSEGKVYSAPAVQTPSVARLRESADKLGFDLTDEQLKEYVDVIEGFLPPYTITDNLPEPTLPVKYPRTPGYQPGKAENEYNAWSRRTDIKGAASGVLANKTVAIKDNVAVAGVPMMNGSRVLEGYTPEYDAEVVTRILDAGGHITGKAACEDLCFCAASFSTCKGTVLNPVNKAYDAGGSSCGSAALVASGAVDLAIGGDQGGSIRIPASRCGIVGLKPTHGLVPYTGAGSMEPTIDHLGPMAKTVTDAALLLEAIAGVDGVDPRQGLVPKHLQKDYTKQLSGDIRGLKVGLLKEGFNQSEGEVSQIVRAAAIQLAKCGAVVEEVSIPQHMEAYACWTVACFDGAWSNMDKGTSLGYKGFYPTTMAEHIRLGFQTKANDLSPTMKATMLMGDYIKSQYGQKFYHKAQNLEPVIRKAYDDVLKEYPILLMPTLTTRTRKLPTKEQAGTVKGYIKHGLGGIQNTAPFDYTGHPAISLNAGSLEDGLPVGVQLVAASFNEAQLLNAAFALEQQLK